MIFCIMGISGAGKTTIARKVAKKLKMNLVISYTSRPIREGEVANVDYHYVDNKYFEENKDDFIEIRDYQVFDGSIWKYGFKKTDFPDPKADYLVVIETDGFAVFSEYFGRDKLKPIVINSNFFDLVERTRKRGDNPEEIKRRINDDERKFEEFAKTEQVSNVYNMFDIDFAVKQVEKIILKGDKQNGKLYE